MTTKITFLRSIILLLTICVSSSLYALTFSTTKTDVSCNGAKTGSIVVSVSDAVGNCYYSLTADFALQQTSNKFENLGAGTYSVYVKDDNGIVGPDNITINEPSELKITETATTASVCENGTIAIVAQGGKAPYRYSLDGFATEQYSNTFSSLQAGTYTAYVKDANGCETNTALNSIVIENKNLSIVQEARTTAAKCYESADGIATLAVRGGIFINDNQPYKITLNKDNAPYSEATYTFTIDGNIVNIEISNLAGGVYAGTIEDLYNCSIPVAFNIARPDKLEVTLVNKTDVLCYGAATGALKFNISKGTEPYTVVSTDAEFAGSITTIGGECVVANLADGTYEFNITDANGCAASTTQTITTLTEELVYNPNKNNVSCAGSATGKVFGTATGGALPYTYTLVGQNISFEAINSIGTFENLAQGSYIASVKDNNGCVTSAPETIYINEPETLTVDPLTAKPAANVVCETDKTASVTFTIVGREEVVATNDTARYYSVKLFDITNQHEIIAPDLKFTNKFHPVQTKNRVEKEPVLDEEGNPTYNELGELITKNVTYKDTIWTQGCYEPTKVEEVKEVSHREYTEDLKGFDCNDKITVSGLGAGAYAIRFFRGECQFAEEMTFTVGITGDIPFVQVNEVGSFCDESTYTIKPTIESNPGVTKYEWTLDNIVIGTSKELSHKFIIGETNRSLKLEVTNRCGSAVSNTVLVQVNPRPTAVLETSKDYLCKNQQTEVTITLKGKGPFTYTLPDGTEKTLAEVFIAEEVVPVKDTVFTLTALKDANCAANIAKDVNTVETKIYPEPEYDMTITVPEPMVSGRYVVVDATEGFIDYSLFINEEEIPAKGPSNLFWAKKFAYGLSTNDFKMLLTDKNGCIWTLEETKVIESTIFPNIFTPNGDGVNDVFLADYDLKVYDRQGTLMYEGTEGWDGTHNGVDAKQGVYLYTVFIPTEDGNLEVIKSTLTLER